MAKIVGIKVQVKKKNLGQLTWKKRRKKKDCLFNVAAPSLPGMEGKDSFHFSQQKKAVDQRELNQWAEYFFLVHLHWRQ